MRYLMSLAVLAGLGFVFAIAVAHGFGVTEITEKSPQVAASTSDRYYDSGNSFVNDLNRLRLTSGVGVVSIDDSLTQIAQIRAQDMSKRLYYAHKNPDGLTYDAYFQTLPDYSCENLNLTSSTRSIDTIKNWYDSAEHQQCMLNNKVSKVGIDTQPFDDSIGTYIYVMILGSE